MNCEKCGEKIVGGVWHRCPESDTKQDSDYLAILREMRDECRNFADLDVRFTKQADALDTAIAELARLATRLEEAEKIIVRYGREFILGNDEVDDIAAEYFATKDKSKGQQHRVGDPCSEAIKTSPSVDTDCEDYTTVALGEARAALAHYADEGKWFCPDESCEASVCDHARCYYVGGEYKQNGFDIARNYFNAQETKG